MRKTISVMILVAGLVPLGIAVATIMGLGLLRQAPLAAVALASIGVVVLPCMGIAAMAGRRLEGSALGTILWPTLLMAGLPLYFPGERQQALAAGLGFLAAPWGPEASMRVAQEGERLGALLGEEVIAGEPPPPMAEVINAPALPPSKVRDQGDDVALPYEGRGRTVRVQVGFEHGESLELPMLFDTGATYTTLNGASLDQLGVKVPQDAPEITLQTAAGPRQAKVVLLDRVWLGGFSVDGVVIAVCEECADDNARGLLGLNVSGQFLVTVDPERHEVVLKPRTGRPDRQLDVVHWVEVQATATAWSDGRVSVEVAGNSKVDRPIAEVLVGIHCQGEDYRATLSHIPPFGVTSTKVALPRGTQCEEYRISLDEARW